MENYKRVLVAASLVAMGCRATDLLTPTPTITPTSSDTPTPTETFTPTPTQTPTLLPTETMAPPVVGVTIQPDILTLMAQYNATETASIATQTAVDSTKIANLNTVVADSTQQEENWKAQLSGVKEMVVQIDGGGGLCSGTILKIESLKDAKSIIYLKSSSHCFFENSESTYALGEVASLTTVADFQSGEPSREVIYVGSSVFGNQTDSRFRHAIAAFVIDSTNTQELTELTNDKVKVFDASTMNSCFTAGFPTNNMDERPAIDVITPITTLESESILEGASLIGNNGISGGPMFCKMPNGTVVDVGENQYKSAEDPIPTGISTYTEADLLLIEPALKELREKALDLIK